MALEILHAILIMVVIWGINTIFKVNAHRDEARYTYDSLIQESDEARFYQFTEPHPVGIDECLPE